MRQEQKYRPLEAGEIIQDGDEFWDATTHQWVKVSDVLFGSAISGYTAGRRPVAVEQVEQVEPADESSSTLAARLQASLDDALRCNTELAEKMDAVTKERDHLKKAYDNCLVQSNLIRQDEQKAKAELAASQRVYMEAMRALEREVVQHQETNRRLDEVCGERNLLQDQLQERAGEARKAEILDFLSVQIAVIPYLQSAVGKDAQRELALVGRTLQMVGKAIQNDLIRRPGESTRDGKEVDGGKE